MLKPYNNEFTTVILGGGLTGLAAGYALAKAGTDVELFEYDASVGGLSKTIESNGFRFDLGGHRFFTKNQRINSFLNNLMEGELISVPRKSTIYLRNKYFDYPLRPANAILGMGVPTTVRIVEDYIAEKIRGLAKVRPQLSLEDWVVGNFGRAMFDIYFKEYSEKVWGIDCSRISVDWVAQRIRGLSLARAVKNAFFKFSGKDIPSLVDKFTYPALGIGRIAERLREEIGQDNIVHTGSPITRINHSGCMIESVEAGCGSSACRASGDAFISSIPITTLVRLLDPPAPSHVREAASKLMFRDLVVVAVMVHKKQVTDQTWIYVPEKKIPFGRIHEPTNWSRKMAPDGNTLLVTEYFSFEGDRFWNASDEHLAEMTVRGLDQLGFVKKSEVSGSVVVRAKKAYPLFEIGYAEQCKLLCDYLSAFRNLHIAGRVGMFRYYNMDHAIESGFNTAEAVITSMSGMSAVQAA
ncbi:MAG: FAD-dependent oxidoreductase [Nitrospirae bacterium]|nr:FAD-dependent oxidoreductase [Nitrospirota bacterium]